MMNAVVVGTTEQPVSSTEEALRWLEVGNTARVTGATQMNQRSSRSHAIFTLLIGKDCGVVRCIPAIIRYVECSLLDELHDCYAHGLV